MSNGDGPSRADSAVGADCPWGSSRTEPESLRQAAARALDELRTVLPATPDAPPDSAALRVPASADASTADGAGAPSACAWILKSVDMSRGRGITLSDNLHTILKRAANKDYRLIVQRYVDRPLLILRRKFDIRQWVLVTSINPVVAWMYSNYYLRFSSRAYTSGDLKNAEVHLTNQSVQKYSDEYGDTIDCNMWAKGQFATYLCEQLGEVHNLPLPQAAR